MFKFHKVQTQKLFLLKSTPGLSLSVKTDMKKIMLIIQFKKMNEISRCRKSFNIQQKGAESIPLTHKYTTAHFSCLGTGTSIKRGGLNDRYLEDFYFLLLIPTLSLESSPIFGRRIHFNLKENVRIKMSQKVGHLTISLSYAT